MAEVAKLRETDHEEAIQSVLKFRLNWNEVRQLVQIVERSQKPLSECLNNVLALRKELHVQHLFVGVILSMQLQEYLSEISQYERKSLLKRALNSLFGIAETAEGSLGCHNFTIVSDHNLLDLLGIEADGLESEINRLLLSYSKLE